MTDVTAIPDEAVEAATQSLASYFIRPPFTAARAVLAAALPAIRQQVAEEIAQAIERYASTGIRPAETAAQIAREIGASS